MRPSRWIGSSIISMVPAVPSRLPSIGVRPAMARISVDLPEPDAPIRATISPRRSDKVTSSSTGTPR